MNLRRVYNLICMHRAQPIAATVQRWLMLVFVLFSFMAIYRFAAEVGDWPLVMPTTLTALVLLVAALTHFSKSAFVEANDELTKLAWYTLPASMLEKWLATWIYTALLIPIKLLIILVVSNELTLFLLDWLEFKTHLPVIEFSLLGFAKYIGWYWLLHAPLFLGTLIFQKAVYLKVTSIVAVVVIVLAGSTTYFAGGMLAQKLHDVMNVGFESSCTSPSSIESIEDLQNYQMQCESYAMGIGNTPLIQVENFVFSATDSLNNLATLVFGLLVIYLWMVSIIALKES